MRVRLGADGADPLYISYYLGHPSVRAWIVRHAVGATMPNLNTSILSSLPLVLPPLPEQRAIARILGALDDKIELNRRMNATLESMARALFQSWFVDFDPVRAKAAGRQPAGLDAETAALFPDAFEDSALGGIPQGWCVGMLGNEFDITMGQSPPGSTYNESGEGLPFFQGRADFGARFPSRRVFCTAPTRLANSGDTLLSVRAPVGDINMATEQCSIGRGVAAIRHASGWRFYTYELMRYLKPVLTRFESEGTVFGSINKQDLHRLKVVAPPDRIVRCFETSIAPVGQVVERNEQNSASLAATRDALLPKLLRGDLDISGIVDGAAALAV